jgi:uncharacterized protein YegP (UPF0339 family)
LPRGDLRLPTGSLDSVKQKGEVPMSAIPIFEVWQSRNNQQWYFRLKAPNHEIICSSEGYTTRSGAEQGLARVKLYAPAAQVRFV